MLRKSFACAVLLSASCAIGQTLYDNGTDPGTLGHWPISGIHSVSDSFVISQPATVNYIVLDIEDVNDLNTPLTADWAISREPFGPTIASGQNTPLTFLSRRYPLWAIWTMAIPYMNVELDPGTYYLQIDHVVTRWGTWAFWGVSGGPSMATYGPPLSGQTQPIASEAFHLVGSWR